MKNNPHYATAEHGPKLPEANAADELYVAADGVTDGTMAFGALNRIAETNLALAYEQRTIAMVEFYKAIRANGARDMDTDELHGLILERLGLKGIKQ